MHLKEQKPVVFVRKTIGSNNSFTVIENKIERLAVQQLNLFLRKTVLQVPDTGTRVLGILSQWA